MGATSVQMAPYKRVWVLLIIGPKDLIVKSRGMNSGGQKGEAVHSFLTMTKNHLH